MEKIMTPIHWPATRDTKEVRWPRTSCRLDRAKSHLAQAWALGEGILAGYVKSRKFLSRATCFSLITLLPRWICAKEVKGKHSKGLSPLDLSSSRVSQNHWETAVTWGMCSKFQFPALSCTLWNLNPMGMAWGLWGWSSQGDSTNQEAWASLGAGCGEHLASITQGQHLPLSHNNSGGWKVLTSVEGAI